MCEYSLIVPHYNDIEGLKRLIRSVPDRSDIQIIIVDDNTYEEPGRIRKELAGVTDSYDNAVIEIYVNGPVRSAGACRNIGLDHADGKWLVFADADDWFTEGAFDVFDTHAGDKEDLIYYASTSVELPDMTPGVRHVYYVDAIRRYIEDRSTEAYLKYQVVVPWAKMVRRDMVEKNRIRYDEVRWSNDVMFSVKTAYCASSVSAYMDCVYCVTRKQGTLTSKRSEEEFKTRFDVYVSEYDYLRGNLNRRDFRFAMGGTGVWVVRAVTEGYGISAIKYVLNTYRKNHIMLTFPISNSVKYILSWFRTGRHDRRYD